MTTSTPDGFDTTDLDRAHAEALREDRGRRLRERWVAWASRQPDPKPSWLTGWDQLDDGQREVDMHMASGAAADERTRLVSVIDAGTTRQNQEWDVMPDDERPPAVARQFWTAGRDEAAGLIESDGDLEAQ